MVETKQNKKQESKKQENKQQIVILGAGITGLAAAYYLCKDYKVIVIEKAGEIGGISTSFKYKDFILDYGPHKIYTQLPGILEEMQKLLPLEKIKKKNSIYLKENYYDFPLKITQILKTMPFTAFGAGLDIPKKAIMKLPDDSYENYLINRFGKTLYNLSFRDYAKKVWNTNPKELDAELAKRRVAISGFGQLLKSILLKDTKKISAEYFYYPKRGMIELITALKNEIEKNQGKILTNSEIKEIKINEKQKEITEIIIKENKTKEHKLKSDYVISTIPVESLYNLVSKTKTTEFKSESKLLDYQNLNIIYFILNKEKALNDCWLFFPEEKWIFQRVSEQKAFSEATCPKDKTVIQVETTKELNEETIKNTISQLEQVNILKKEEIIEYFTKTIKDSYPIYKKGFLEKLNQLLVEIEKINNLYTIGRPGLFNYNNIDQCWDMAMKTAEQIRSNKTKEDWQKTKEYFNNYKIVD